MEKTTINRDRPGKIDYYLNIARSVSERGTCLRRKFGAIIVKDDRIVSTGYVGAPRGRINCCDRGTCFRMENNIPSGTRYEMCRSIHAEMNAIISASKEEMQGAVMYLCGIEPDGSITPNADCCSMCKRAIINAGIKYVIIKTPTGSNQIDTDEWIIHDDSLYMHDSY
jgi:dCMP deaminase